MTPTQRYRRDYLASLDADLRLRQVEADQRRARVAACRGEYGADAQIIALAAFVGYLVSQGRRDAALALRAFVKRRAAELEKMA